MNFIEQFDKITIDQLRATGATKWAAEDGTIGAFVAEMDFGTAPVVTDALHQAIKDKLFGYMPPGLAAEMKQATSDWVKTHNNWVVDPADIYEIPDVLRGLELAIKYLSRPGSKVIVPTPSYMPFLRVPGELDRELIQVPMHDDDGYYTYDLDALQAAFDDGGNLLILCNPYNPVGRVFSEKEMLDIADLVERNGGKVFSDEIWSPLVYGDQKHISYASINEVTAGHTLTAMSASKAFNLPGLKCAQLIVSNDVDRETFKKEAHFASHGTANFGVAANIAAFREGRPWLDGTLGYLDRNRKALAELVEEHLPGVRYRIPDGAYIGWLDFRDSAAAENPAAFFKQAAGVALTEGTACGETGTGFARFIFATPLPVMEQAFSKMGEALRGKNSK